MKENSNNNHNNHNTGGSGSGSGSGGSGSSGGSSSGSHIVDSLKKANIFFGNSNAQVTRITRADMLNSAPYQTQKNNNTNNNNGQHGHRGRRHSSNGGKRIVSEHSVKSISSSRRPKINVSHVPNENDDRNYTLGHGGPCSNSNLSPRTGGAVDLTDGTIHRTLSNSNASSFSNATTTNDDTVQIKIVFDTTAHINQGTGI
ncbi:hypothetical protein PACTADRAFT_50229 [Pachysolen tannophilus NRRL Y-2460]|uniref:Uncharacterized protein n=1 Tax=Pachysolen tannophilus NRRL Y-2460 TaxID=669874 RepID=A0A1E4TUR2_PACTA|nr:hypothetical protein PACTADRAFT_50229 [Pachysolen tannophilus NRRL Y-2460]